MKPSPSPNLDSHAALRIWQQESSHHCSNCDYQDECRWGARHPESWCQEWTVARIDPGSRVLGMVGVVMFVLGVILLLLAVSCNH